MERTYKIGDIITVRGRRYQVRSQSEYRPFGYCEHCDFKRRGFCNLRSLYDHFLEDCSISRVYFSRL